jgi:hypothetical protein
MQTILKPLFFFSIIISFTSCNQKKAEEPFTEYNPKENKDAVTTQKAAIPLSQEFKDYWYASEAEITSYQLEQARYGEMRQGTAVLVYVTEDFDKKLQVKADQNNSTNIPVLKLNATKKFNTGIYPYSIMQSTFFPVNNNKHALKVSCSVQEWCGHVFMQLNNREQFTVGSHSYFQSDADQKFEISKDILENELWTQLRIDPKSLPQGYTHIIPSLEYSRLKHVELKSYKAIGTLTENTYTIEYPELNRTLSITFNPQFPYDILGWEETFKSGFGKNAKMMTTKATKLKTIKSAYWGKNSNADENLRETLMLQ